MVGHRRRGVDDAPQDRPVRQGTKGPRVPRGGQRQRLVVGEDPAVPVGDGEGRRRGGRPARLPFRCGCRRFRALLSALGGGGARRRGEQELLSLGGRDAPDEDLGCRVFFLLLSKFLFLSGAFSLGAEDKQLPPALSFPKPPLYTHFRLPLGRPGPDGARLLGRHCGSAERDDVADGDRRGRRAREDADKQALDRREGSC